METVLLMIILSTPYLCLVDDYGGVNFDVVTLLVLALCAYAPRAWIHQGLLPLLLLL